MADLTKLITQDYITERIDKEYERRRVPRTHLGLSECGHSCQRYLWYVYNNYPQKTIPGRILRLFELGNILEERIRQDFMNAGFPMCSDQAEVSFDYTDPITGKKYVLKGHIDGIVSGLNESEKPHLWECKTAGEKAFKKLIKLNSFEEWNPIYKFQVHAYMLGMGLDRALVTVYNKDNSHLYQERIKLDKDWIVKHLEIVFKTIGRNKPPARMCPRSDWWEAKFCNHRSNCWNE